MASDDVLPGFLQELRCTICEGSDPHIARFGIAAEASIFPDPRGPRLPAV